MQNITIRTATRNDCIDLAALIRELAQFEHLEQEVSADARTLEQSLFDGPPRAFALMAEAGGKTAGFCLYFYNFSTFLGRPGLYIEDIFIRPAFRKQGIGKRFFTQLAEIARKNRCGRMEWWVLDWNKSAIEFYERLGAVPMSEWIVYRLTSEKFASLEEA